MQRYAAIRRPFLPLTGGVARVDRLSYGRRIHAIAPNVISSRPRANPITPVTTVRRQDLKPGCPASVHMCYSTVEARRARRAKHLRKLQNAHEKRLAPLTEIPEGDEVFELGDFPEYARDAEPDGQPDPTASVAAADGDSGLPPKMLENPRHTFRRLFKGVARVKKLEKTPDNVAVTYLRFKDKTSTQSGPGRWFKGEGRSRSAAQKNAYRLLMITLHRTGELQRLTEAKEERSQQFAAKSIAKARRRQRVKEQSGQHTEEQSEQRTVPNGETAINEVKPEENDSTADLDKETKIEMRKARRRKTLNKMEVPIDLAVDEDLLIAMRNAFGQLRKCDPSSAEQRGQTHQARVLPANVIARTNITSQSHWKEVLSNQMLGKYKRSVLATKRDQIDSLQINQRKDEVLDLVRQNTYSMIVAATGTGKSSQLPQVFLNDAIERGAGSRCKVACIQPRRIAASSIARRVASERGERLGQSVGYQVRFDRRLPKEPGSITYFTTGIMLELLLRAEGALDGFSHIVLDEVHERDISLDYLMMLVRNFIRDRQAKGAYTPKVIITSATLDVDRFANYFQNQSSDGSLSPAPDLHIPGRTFEVKRHYLEHLLSELSKNHSEDFLQPFFSEMFSAMHLDRHRKRSGRLARYVETAAGQEESWEPESWKDNPSPEIGSSESLSSSGNEPSEANASPESDSSLNDFSAETKSSESEFPSETRSSEESSAQIEPSASQYSPENAESDLSTEVESSDGQSQPEKLPELSSYQEPSMGTQINRLENTMPGSAIGLICAAIFNILTTSSADGAILVFLPGMRDITATERFLRQFGPSFNCDMFDEERYRILKLHSELPDEHMAAFQEAEPGCRRIILSTNIAETSVTITDVRYVIDSGLCRQKKYYPDSRSSTLAYSWVSKSCVAQRAGRAGRVQDGEYWAMYPQETFDCLGVNKSPEMVLADLQGICLRVRNVNTDVPIAQILDQVLQPPERERVAAAIDELQYLGAMDENEQLTSLGESLSKLPVAPRLGKLIVLGLRFRCLDPLLIVAALGGDMNVYTGSMFEEDKKAQMRIAKMYGDGAKSDFLAGINAFKAVRKVLHESGREAAHTLAFEQWLHFSRFLESMRVAPGLLRHMTNSGLIDAVNAQGHDGQFGSDAMNVNSGNTALVKALLVHVFSRNLAKRTRLRHLYRIEPTRTGEIATFSLNHDHPMSLFCYGDKSPSSSESFNLNNTSQISPLAACLLGGSLETSGDEILIDSWLRVRINAETSSRTDEYAIRLLVELRKMLDTALNTAIRNWDPRDNHGPIRDTLSRTLADFIGPVLQREAARESHNDEARRAIPQATNTRVRWTI